MPLFEWRISEIVTDFPSTYDVSIKSSPWTAYLGDSLDDGLYVFHQVSVEMDGKLCRAEDFNFVVRRSRNDKALEQALNVNIKNLLWLNEWSAIEVLLSVIYIWLFTIWYERYSGCGYAVVYTVIAGCIYFLGSQVVRLLRGPLRPLTYDFGALDCRGTATFSAGLSKVHYETPIVLFVVILLELGALGVMLYPVVKAIIERKRL